MSRDTLFCIKVLSLDKKNSELINFICRGRFENYQNITTLPIYSKIRMEFSVIYFLVWLRRDNHVSMVADLFHF